MLGGPAVRQPRASTVRLAIVGTLALRDGSDRQANRSRRRRHTRQVSDMANACTIAQPRGFAGVATASRSDVRRPCGTPTVRSCCRAHDAITFNQWSHTPPAPNQPRRQRPTRPTTDPTPTAPNTTQPHSVAHRRNPTTTPPTATPKPPKTTTTEHHLQRLTNARTRGRHTCRFRKRNPTGVIPGVIRASARVRTFTWRSSTIDVTERAAVHLPNGCFSSFSALESIRETARGHASNSSPSPIRVELREEGGRTSVRTR